MAYVYIVTHGDKIEGPNPGMNPGGFTQIQSLASHLPKDPPAVVCGTGKRHLDTAKALGLTPTRWTAVVGDATSLEKIDGKPTILLPDGTTLPREAYSTPEDLAHATEELMASLLDNTIICAGRPVMIALGLREAKNGAIYRIMFLEIPIFPGRSIHEIKEVAVAGGDVGAGPKEG